MTVEELRALREGLGLRQDHVAMVLGFASGARLRNYESARRAFPDDEFRRYALYLTAMATAHRRALERLAARAA